MSKDLHQEFYVIGRDQMVLHYRDEKWNHRTKEMAEPEGLSLRAIADFVCRFRRYELYMKRVEGIAVSEMSDFEGHPYDNRFWFSLERSGDNTGATLGVTFHACSLEADHDYVDRVWADRSTPYRFKAGPEYLSGFRIERAQFSRARGDAIAWIVYEMQRLKCVLDGLDEATSCLNGWKESGLSMLVACTNSFLCDKANTYVELSPQRVAEFARLEISVEELKRRLKCRQCGSRVDKLVVAPPRSLCPVTGLVREAGS